MPEVDYTVIVTSVTAVIGSVVTAFFAARKALRKSTFDANAAVQTGFLDLTKTLKDEREFLNDQIVKQTAVIERQSGEINTLRRELSRFEITLNEWLVRWKHGEPAPPVVDIVKPERA